MVTLVLAALVRTLLAQPFYIPSGSMQNTLQRGDRVLVDKTAYHRHGIHRGDVVVFNGLDSFTPEASVPEPHNPVAKGLRTLAVAIGMGPPGEKDFIKRVIGLPGDRVRCCAAGLVSVNGVQVDESRYIFPGNAPSEVSFDVTVPAGRLWVMGDHRAASADSRAHLGDPGGGTVPADKVIGRALAVVWPLSRASGLSGSELFDQVALGGAVRVAHAVPSRQRRDIAVRVRATGRGTRGLTP